MERLTERSASGNAYYPECFNGECAGLGCKSPNKCEFINTVCERLAAYEDAEERGRRVEPNAKWTKKYQSGHAVHEGVVSSCCDMWNERKTYYCPNCGANMEDTQ